VIKSMTLFLPFLDFLKFINCCIFSSFTRKKRPVKGLNLFFF
jgi:hypothetical protein